MTQLLPFISKQFNGIIWRMEIDEIGDTIYLEVRKTEDKLVSFAAVDLLSGQTNFEDITLPERWLAGIEAAYNNILLLHGYQGQNAPVHRGLTALAEDGSVLWSNYSIVFDHLSINGPVTYATQIQPRKLFLTDVGTGANIRQFDSLSDSEYINNIVFPQSVNDSELNFKLPVKSYDNVVDYLTYNNYRVVSLHTLNGEQLVQVMYVWDGEVLVYQDILNDNIQKMQPEAFILCKNRIIYIKNKTGLKVISL
ncbi:DUF4905 domain-containing protein [Mucilaginibacter calamicampi]|uniref:DUF4905 domain-containing protein n=1 Tax=Mucilaginibacter calamicampi TaxID=1302352 RepID=A0ABW2YT00_9SPHI